MKSIKYIISIAAFVAAASVAQAQFSLGTSTGTTTGAAPSTSTRATTTGRQGRGRRTSSGFGNSSAADTSSAPWKAFPLSAKTTVNLNFRNASIDAVIHVFSTASGIPIIKDPSLTGGITLESPKPQSLSDAFAMFNAVLSLKGYDITKEGSFLQITAKNQAGGRPGFGTGTPGSTTDNPLASISPGSFSTQSVRIFSIKYASASALATLINNLYATNSTSNNGFASFFQGLGGGFGPNAGIGAQGGRGRNQSVTTNSTVKATSDDYSNSLIVLATDTQIDEISDIVSRIDQKQTSVDQPHVFKLYYAKAADMQTVIQSVISNSTTLGRSSTSTSGTSRSGTSRTGGGFSPFGGGFGGFGSSSSSSSTSVTADTRSNSIVVTASDDVIAKIAIVVKELDKPALYESTTWARTLRYARADVVANLLGQAFGSRSSGSTATAGSLSGSTLSTLSSSSGSSSSASNLGNTSTQTSRNSSSSSSATIATLGMSNTQQVLNIKNLAGEVTLVANSDTNSIIVTCPPEDRALIDKLFDQLDVTPKQVVINAIVVEASLSDTDKLGFEWKNMATKLFGSDRAGGSGSTAFGYGSDLNSNSTSTGLAYTLTAGQYSLFVQAIKQDKNLRVLSSPSIFTTNNASGQIKIAQLMPYETGSTVDTSTGATTYSYSNEEIGLVLTVTPHISDDGVVTMDINQQANEYAGADTTLQNAPIINEREAQSTVSIKDGQTMVLGGIIQDSIEDDKYKVPLLGDVPLLGSLFRSRTKIKSKTELVIFLTPHVVSSAADAKKYNEEAATSLKVSGDIAKEHMTTVEKLRDGVAIPSPLPAYPERPTFVDVKPDMTDSVNSTTTNAVTSAPLTATPGAAAPAAKSGVASPTTTTSPAIF